MVVEAGPLGLEMVTALAHRGVETHLIDPNPYALAMMADPDIMAPVQESWSELGVHMHFNTTLEAFLGDEKGAVRAVQTSDGEIPAELVVVATHKTPNNRLAKAAGLKIGSTGGIIVDERMKTSAPDVLGGRRRVRDPARAHPHPAAGAHRLARLRAGQDGRHQRRRRRAGLPGGVRAVGDARPGKWVIGGASFGETTATALGIPYVLAGRRASPAPATTRACSRSRSSCSPSRARCA